MQKNIFLNSKRWCHLIQVRLNEESTCGWKRVPHMRSTERERCLSVMSCNSWDRRRRPGGRVRTRQRVSDVFQLIGASRRGRQPHFRINNLMNGKPAWEPIRCNGFTLMRPRAKTSKDEFLIFDIYRFFFSYYF